MPLQTSFSNSPEGCKERAVQRAAEELNDDLQRFYEFGKEWLLEFELTRSQELIITNLVADNKVIVEDKEQLEALGSPLIREVTGRYMPRQ